MAKLIEFNAKARAARNAKNTASLHDFSRPREEMATASEIGGCARRVVVDLHFPPTHDDRQLMVFERGHVFETMQEENLIAMGFKKVTPKEFASAPGPCFVGGVGNQLTLEHPTLPIGAHLDFVVKHRNGALFVIECKTTDGIPSDPYGNYVEQLHAEMGLLHIKFPDTDIRGSILVRDLNKGREHEFDGYAFNSELFNFLLKKGIHLALAKQGKATPTTTPSHLCGFCNHRAGCPAHAGAAEIPEAILVKAEQLERLTANKKALDEEIEAIKAQLLEYTGERYRGEYEGLGLTATTVPDTEYDAVDSEALKANFPEAFATCSKKKKRAGYTKIEVKRMKEKPAKTLKEPKASKAKKAKPAVTEEAVAQAA